MNDLLGNNPSLNRHVRGAQLLPRDGRHGTRSSDPIDVEMGMQSAGASASVADFNARIEAINQKLLEVNRAEKAMHELHERSKITIKSKDVMALQQQMQAEIDKGNQVLQRCHEMVKSLNNDSATWPHLPPDVRSRNWQAIKNKVQKRMMDFQATLEGVKDDYRQTVKSRLYTVTGEHVTDDQADAVIERGQGEVIFEQALKGDRRRILDTLAEVQERHDEVQKLLKSIHELADLMADIAAMVETQATTVNYIGDNVNKAEMKVAEGTQHIGKATTHWKSRNKLICIISSIVIIILIIILAVVLVTARNK